MPFDTAKSIIQVDLDNNKGFVKIMQDIYRTKGIKGLYRGYAPTVMRAMPSNAIIFSVYELTRRALTTLAEKTA